MSKYRHAQKPGIGKIITIILIVLLAVALVVGGVFAVTTLLGSDDNTQETVATKAPTKPTATEVPTEPHTENPDVKYSALAKEYLDNMTADEKIYQLLMVTPEALTGVDVATQAGDTTKQVLTEKNVGGVYYSAQNFEDSTQTLELIANTKNYAKHPLFIAITEKGGENSPLATKLEISNENSADASNLSYDANFIATNLAKYGFNFNFAPATVADENNPYMKTAELVNTQVAKDMKSYIEKGIVPAINSFPVAEDSEKTYDEMKTSEFVPFENAINESADVIMLSHNKVSAIDSATPAFMSNRLVTEILLKELKFIGLVISPMLNSEALDSYSIDDIVTKSINAGVNMFVCPSDIDGYVTAIKSALDKGLIKQAQIDECVTKILAVKFKHGIIKEEQAPTDAPTQADTQENTQPATEQATN